MKKLSLFAVAMCGLMSANAADLTPAEALARLGKSGALRKHAAVDGTRQALTPIAELPNLYVFSTGSGYMILPSNDVAAPLLGYAENGTFDLEANPALAAWLEFYSDEIEAAANAGVQAYDEAAADENEAEEPVARVDVAPMITSQWNQMAPYNAKCPELSGKRCMTGCVATAMAQVMNFHKWPDVGEGSYSYKWERGGQQLSADFSKTEFDWANMTDTYSSASTDAEIDAVATLMFTVGVSVNMGYNTDQSGATSASVGTALMRYFKYDKAMRMAERNRYTLDDWTDLIYGELAAGRPVVYSGKTKAGGGHEFVCDGYRAEDGFFHFNWGWSGVSDGYFALTALNPGATGVGGGNGGYNYEQDAIIGIQKLQPDSQIQYVMVCAESFTASPATVGFGEQVTFGGGFINQSFENMPGGIKIGVRIRPFVGGAGTTRHMYNTENRSIPASMGYRTINVNMPGVMKDGNYVVTPVYMLPGEKEWRQMEAPLNCEGALKATVADKKITFSKYDPEEEKEESGIESVEAAPAAADGAWFTIDGRRLASKPSVRGIYIHNGRKLTVK